MNVLPKGMLPRMVVAVGVFMIFYSAHHFLANTNHQQRWLAMTPDKMGIEAVTTGAKDDRDTELIAASYQQ